MKMNELKEKYKPSSNSGWLSLEKGKISQVRVVSELFPLQLAPFKETPSRTVFLCRVIDREDGQIKLFKMGQMIYGQYMSYYEDPDYTWEDIPDFELRIKAESTGSLPQNVKYHVTAGIPGKVQITSEEREEIAKLPDLKEIADKLQALEMEKMKSQIGEETITQETPTNQGESTDGNQGPFIDENGQQQNEVKVEDIPF